MAARAEEDSPDEPEHPMTRGAGPGPGRDSRWRREMAPGRTAEAATDRPRTADTNDGTCASDCSLREAINAAERRWTP